MHLMPQFEHGVMEARGSMDMEGDDKGEEATPRRILSSSTPSSQRPLNFRKKFLTPEVVTLEDGVRNIASSLGTLRPARLLPSCLATWEIMFLTTPTSEHLKRVYQQ